MLCYLKGWRHRKRGSTAHPSAFPLPILVPPSPHPSLWAFPLLEGNSHLPQSPALFSFSVWPNSVWWRHPGTIAQSLSGYNLLVYSLSSPLHLLGSEQRLSSVLSQHTVLHLLNISTFHYLLSQLTTVLLKGGIMSNLLGLSNDLHRSWCSVIVFWDLSKFSFFCFSLWSSDKWWVIQMHLNTMTESCALSPFLEVLVIKLLLKKLCISFCDFFQGVLSLAFRIIRHKLCLFLPLDLPESLIKTSINQCFSSVVFIQMHSKSYYNQMLLQKAWESTSLNSSWMVSRLHME